MMRPWLCLVLAAAPLPAAILRGYVVEHASGKVLARAQVAIQPLPGTNGPTLSVRTNSYGIFEFINIPAGAYLVNGSRRGFAPVHYGQKRWNAAGTPVVVEQDRDITISLRLPRYGGITGYVVDENDVGMPEQEVMAYRNTRPPKIAAKFPTDDRGWFRMWGLEPGTYLVRTGAKGYEDGGYLPTFFRETMRVEEAAHVQVALDEDTPDVRVRPFPGKLMNISGLVRPCTNPPRQVAVTLVSDMGRETMAGPVFSFGAKPPGNYEIFADSPGDGRNPRTNCGAYMPLALDNRDYNGIDLALLPLPEISFAFEGVPGIDAGAVRIQARRKDLAGESEPQTLRAGDVRVALNRGRWELQLVPASSYVAVDFHGPHSERGEGGRADGWNEILVDGSTAVKYVLSSKPGMIHGLVTGPGHSPAPGAPVLLEAWDGDARKRVRELRTVRADMQGRYQIYGLAPGTYRIFATYDFEAPDAAEADLLSPQTIKVEEGRDLPLDLELAEIR